MPTVHIGSQQTAGILLVLTDISLVDGKVRVIGGWLDTRARSDYGWPLKDRNESCKQPMSLSKPYLADSPSAHASLTACACKLSSCTCCARFHTQTIVPQCKGFAYPSLAVISTSASVAAANPCNCELWKTCNKHKW